jgi:hypothetical protein
VTTMTMIAAAPVSADMTRYMRIYDKKVLFESIFVRAFVCRAVLGPEIVSLMIPHPRSCWQ